MKFIQEIRLTLIIALMIMGTASLAMAQSVNARSGPTRDGGTIRFQKDVPVRINPVIKGNGIPSQKFVIQLARFEVMNKIPARFPKGTFLYINPDHPKEKWLLVGFYDSYADANAAAQQWKKNPMFRDAYARSKPFIVTYD